MTTRRFALLALLAFLPLVSSIAFGYSGHDLPFHLGTWFDLRANWQAHTLFPGWAAAANFGLGDARFCYYPPISYLVAGALSLVVPLRFLVGAYIWLVLLGAGLSAYYASREFVPEEDRFGVACLYLLNPYLLVTATVRFAAAEMLVQACLPLIVLLFVRSQLRDDSRAAWRASVWLALLLGLSWLTNLPASIVLGYALGLASAWVAWRARSVGPLVRYGAAQAVAIGIAAVHLVPAFLDKKLISSAQILSFDFRTNFLIFPRPFHAFLGFCVLAAWAGVVLLGLAWRTAQVRATPPLQLLLVLGGLAFFFQIPLSYALWRYLPMLPFVQFPFRFLSLTGLVTAILIMGVTHWRRFRKLAYAAVGAIALSVAIGQQLLNFVVHRSPAPFAQTWAKLSEGYAGVPEYVPVTAPSQQGADGAARPPRVVASVPPGVSCTVEVQAWTPAERSIETDASGPCSLRVATLDFPYWHARSKDGALRHTHADHDGWLVVDVPSGHEVTVLSFETETPVRTQTRVLSAALVLGAALALFGLRKR